MCFFVGHGPDPITSKPFAVAFREKVQNALRLFVDYKRPTPVCRCPPSPSRLRVASFCGQGRP